MGTELRTLVRSLDGMKTGEVDYTLLVAAALPAEVYCDEERSAEAFDSLDFKKQGVLSPESLRKLFPSKDAKTKNFAELIEKFDTNKDGVLDIDEFRQMLRGVHAD